MSDLSAGMVLEWASNTDNVRLTRILWVDPRQNSTVLFDMQDSKALPEIVNTDELLLLLESNEVRAVSVVCEKSLVKETDLRDTYRQRRDKAWSIIKDIVVDEPAIYDQHLRWHLIQDAQQRSGTSRQQIYTWLRRYWRDGKIVNALLPNYDYCGGTRATSTMSTKVGRKSLRAQGNPELQGIPITPEIENIFQVAIDKWYHKELALPLTKVFQKMLGRFFHTGFVERDGVMVPELLPPEQRPTIRQFRYWYSKTRDRERALRTRLGSTAFERGFRPVLGNTNHEAKGPGHVFQIDATIADVWLVHRYNRSWLIGKPVLYFVVDVFSRLIAGLYVGLEGPSWLGAMMALENAASDKVAYCADHGIQISPAQWPAQHLPEILTSDRGELEGTRPTQLIQTLHTDVQTLPPYRPDWKPIVERSFRLSNDDTIRWIPGSVPERVRERGRRKYQLDAVLDIEEFEQVMIRMIIKYNNFHVLSGYERSKNMIADEVAPVPMHLWNWGRKREYNGLHTFPRDILRLNLLPMESARITQKGIRFHNRYYVGETALRKQWFVGGVKTRSIDVHFDPRNNETIYIRLDGGRGFEVCHLADIYSRYRELRDEEARDIDAYEGSIKQELSAEEMQAGVQLDAQIDAIVHEATKKKQDMPAKAMTQEHVRLHRADEKQRERQNRAWHLGEEAHDGGKVVKFPLRSEFREEDTPDYSDLIDEETMDSGKDNESDD